MGTSLAFHIIFSALGVGLPLLFLGASAAAVASGRIVAQNGTVQADLGSSWTTPFALTIGAMAVSLCATLAAVYLTVEASDDHDEKLAEMFRLRAIIAGAITAVLGALGLILSPGEAPILWQGLLNRALPVVIATMVIGLITAASLFVRGYREARVLIVLETAFLLGSWGLSQYPYIIPPRVTIENSANVPSVLVALLISIAVGMVILIPSLYYLFAVFKISYPAPGLKRREQKEESSANQDASQQKSA